VSLAQAMAASSGAAMISIGRASGSLSLTWPASTDAKSELFMIGPLMTAPISLGKVVYGSSDTVVAAHLNATFMSGSIDLFASTITGGGILIEGSSAFEDYVFSVGGDASMATNIMVATEKPGDMGPCLTDVEVSDVWEEAVSLLKDCCCTEPELISIRRVVRVGATCFATGGLLPQDLSSGTLDPLEAIAYTPALDGSTLVFEGDLISVEFNNDIVAGTGSVTILDSIGGFLGTIPVFEITFSARRLFIDISAFTVSEGTYTIQIPEGMVLGSTSAAWKGIFNWEVFIGSHHDSDHDSDHQ